MSRKNSKKSDEREFHLPRIVAFALILCCVGAVFAAVYIIAGKLDQKISKSGIAADSFHPVSEEKGYARGSVKLKNKVYDYYHSFENYLIMGTDERDKDVEQSGNGMADYLLLLSIDRSADTYSLLEIDRDTIGTVNLIGDNGKGEATAIQQICMAHGYGSTADMGCSNMVRAVSKILGDLPIMGYYSVGMTDIPKLNHAIGGVTVTLTEDFTKQDPAMKKGATLKLSDDQAAIYLRSRMGVGEGTNEERMARQHTYLENFLNQSVDKIKARPKYFEELLDETNEFAVSNLTNSQLSRIAKALTENERKGIFKFDGKHKKGTVLSDGQLHMEFYPSAASIKDVLTEMLELVPHETETKKNTDSQSTDNKKDDKSTDSKAGESVQEDSGADDQSTENSTETSIPADDQSTVNSTETSTPADDQSTETSAPTDDQSTETSTETSAPADDQSTETSTETSAPADDQSDESAAEGGKHQGSESTDAAKASVKLGETTFEYPDTFSTYLLIGTGGTGNDDPYNFQNDMADYLLLLIEDKATNTYSLLTLDPDTISAVQSLDANNQEAGSANTQICLAHSFGSTKEAGCENQVKAVSDLLGGLPIDGYYAFSLNDVEKLNQAIGGVEVTLTEDFSGFDPKMQKGATLTLQHGRRAQGPPGRLPARLPCRRCRKGHRPSDLLSGGSRRDK